MPLTVPNLVLRQTKGSPLTIPEMDGNFEIIAAFLNTIAGLIAATLNPDGTLVDDSVGENALQDRIVGANNLKPDALPFFADTGNTNAYVIAPDPALVAYADKIIFFIAANTANTGPSTLSAIAGLPPVAILDISGNQLQAGAIQKNQVFVVAYYAGAFRLVASSSAGSGGTGTGTTNFTGLTRFDPADFALPGNGNSNTQAHGFNSVPEVRVSLVCQIADANCQPGDVVPVSDFEDSSAKLPCFLVRANTTNIVVAQTAASISLAGTVITQANWLIRVSGRVTFNEATQMFPAVEVTAARPDGAMSYGNFMFFFGRAASGNSATYAQQLNLQTGKLVILNTAPTTENFQQVNVAIFRNAAGKDIIIWTCSTGTYSMFLQDPTPTAWHPVRFCATTFGGNLNNYKPVSYDEVNNLIYAVASSHSTGDVHALKIIKIDVGANTATATGTNLNLTAGGANWGAVLGANVAEYAAWYPNGSTANVILFQYNPILKRIYVATDDVAAVHIFDITTMPGLTGTSIDLWTWWNQADATRMAQLKYLKTIAIGGGVGLTTGNQNFDRMAIEFDLTTGIERAISLAKSSDQFTGAVIRIPWLEMA